MSIIFDEIKRFSVKFNLQNYNQQPIGTIFNANDDIIIALAHQLNAGAPGGGKRSVSPTN